jgi:hypothetical protein
MQLRWHDVNKRLFMETPHVMQKTLEILMAGSVSGQQSATGVLVALSSSFALRKQLMDCGAVHYLVQCAHSNNTRTAQQGIAAVWNLCSDSRKLQIMLSEDNKFVGDLMSHVAKPGTPDLLLVRR